MKQCPICNADLKKETRRISFDYRGNTLDVEMPGSYCDVCNESFHNSEEQKIIDKNILLAKRESEHLLLPKDLKRIRKRFHISQKEAGAILGGGIRAFSKYENAQASQPRSTDIILKLLDQGKIGWDDIKAIGA